MRIQSEDGHHFIQVTQQEVSLPFYPSISVQIEASASGFSVSMNQIWLSADDMYVFLTELVHLEQQRSGIASLASMSPGEAMLSLQTIDRAGHMIAKLDLTRSVFLDSFSPLVDQHLSITFKIDAFLLPKLVRSFEQLIPLYGKDESK